MSEANLKLRWRRHAAKHGVWSRSMSPHQIPGCPDIIAMDCCASDVIREMARGRGHWIEAKALHAGPSAFRASRDATAPQVAWIRTVGELGGSAWWLVLGPSTWLLVPWSTNEVARDEFVRRAKRYGAPPTVLFEPESPQERKRLAEAAGRRIEAVRAESLRGRKVR